MSATMARVTVGDDVYELDPDQVDNIEAMEIEEQAGYEYLDWIQALNDKSIRAITALVWIARARQDPAVRFRDVKFKISELKFEVVSSEPVEGQVPKEEPEPGQSLEPTTTANAPDANESNATAGGSPAS